MHKFKHCQITSYQNVISALHNKHPPHNGIHTLYIIHMLIIIHNLVLQARLGNLMAAKLGTLVAVSFVPNNTSMPE